MTEELELVRELEPFKEGQLRELYKRGGDYFIVSTVELQLAGDPIGELTNALSPLRGTGYDYPTGGTETMAFPSNAEGDDYTYTEVAAANGGDSRAEVLRMLGGRRDETWEPDHA